ncbi:MAG: molybdopterin-dependent oxidoreductase, partial [Deltaproteobacteria bacterium]|nr:molybdopterin-dependent oxidoreductase [Deltaproteobacteria bacterium]
MEFTRRKFLALTAAAAGVSLLPVEIGELAAAVSESEHQWPGPGVETWVNSVCQLCPGGCGIRVRVLDGWPVKVRGNPDHPVNQGGLCPKGASGLQALYDPDRIRRPMKRAGGRGENKWAEISWDEAIGLVAEKLGPLRESGHPEGLVVIGGQYRGLMRNLWDRFLAAYGSPNYVATTLGCVASDSVLHLTQGIAGHIGYDIDRTNYVLSFGVSLLEASWSPVWQMRAQAELRQGRPGRRGKITQVDTRFSATAAKADTWVPIRSGTDGALALGIAHVIIKDGLYDEAFVREHAYGFEDWTDRSGRSQEGFREMVMRDYPPAVVESLTGVPKLTVARIAREFASARPAIAMADRGAARYSNGVYTQWAVQCLNALVGSVDRPGGTLFPSGVPFTPFEALPRNEIAERGRGRPRLDGVDSRDAPLAASSAIQHLPQAILSGEPYPAEAVFLYQTNPCFSLPREVRMEEALRKVPLVVSFSPFIDESTRAADLVLPDHTYLERWQDDPTPRNVGFPVLGVRRPVRSPLYDTRATSDVLFALSEALGDPVRKALPWKDTESFLKERIRGVHEAGRGMMAAAVESPWYESFRKAEGTALPATFDEFWDALLERGAWWDPEYRFEDWGRTLKTPSGKFEFCSDTVRAALTDSPRRPSASAVPASAENTSATDGERKFQGFQPPVTMEEGTEYPLVLNVFRPTVFYGGRTANMPYLLEIAGKNRQVGWES